MKSSDSDSACIGHRTEVLQLLLNPAQQQIRTARRVEMLEASDDGLGAKRPEQSWNLSLVRLPRDSRDSRLKPWLQEVSKSPTKALGGFSTREWRRGGRRLRSHNPFGDNHKIETETDANEYLRKNASLYVKYP